MKNLTKRNKLKRTSIALLAGFMAIGSTPFTTIAGSSEANHYTNIEQKEIQLITSIEEYNIITRNEELKFLEYMLYPNGYFVIAPTQEDIEFISISGEQRIPIAVTFAPNNVGLRNIATVQLAGGSRIRFNVASNATAHISVGVIDSATNRVTWASNLTGTITLPQGNVRNFTIVVNNNHIINNSISVAGGAYITSLMAFDTKIPLTENPSSGINIYSN